MLAFDDGYRLRTANASAAVILQQPLAEVTGMPLSDWGRKLPALAPFAELVAEGFRASGDAHWQKQAELSVSNLMRTLLMRGSRLPVTPVAGYVVVFDDVTDLAQAQRDAAWGEVARRLAHEIKNPLTPIQLSAERLERKLAPKLAGADQETLARGAQTIIAQVAAMKHMVDDFAIYARQTRPGTMQPVDIGALLLDVLALYDNLRPHVAFVASARAARRARRSRPACARFSTIFCRTPSTPSPSSPTRATTSRSKRAAMKSGSHSATAARGFPIRCCTAPSSRT